MTRSVAAVGGIVLRADARPLVGVPDPQVTTLPETPAPALTRPALWRRLLPLWRHAVWATVLFAVCAVAVSVRLDVQQLRKDLDRNARLEHEARLLNERLRLEVDARRRVLAVEQYAGALALGVDARVVNVSALPSRTED